MTLYVKSRQTPNEVSLGGLVGGQSFEIKLLKLIVKTQRNSTQLKATLKQLALELDIVVTCSTHICCEPPPYML